MSWFSKLQRLGIAAEHSPYLRTKLLLTNRLTLAMFAMGVPYAVAFYVLLPPGFLLVAIACLFLYGSILALNAFGWHILSRFLFSVAISIICFGLHIAMLKENESLLNGFLALQVAMLIIPWTVFDIREPFPLYLATCVCIACLLSLKSANNWLDVNMDTTMLKSDLFSLIFMITAVTVLVGGLFLLQSANRIAEQGNQQLLDDMQNNQHLLQEKENRMNDYVAEIEKSRTEDQKRHWASEGLTKFTELIRSQENLQHVSDTIISALVKYMNANQGALYILNDEEQTDIHLEALACYAWERKKQTNKKIAIGEGLLGQCWIEKDVIYLTDVPDQYVNITSGLGLANPRSIIMVPLQVNDEVYGVIELASFKEFEDYQQDFLVKLAETIASFLVTARINEKTRLLLDQTQQQSEEMRAAEEEMRQNMEELSATQEELQRKEREYLNRIEALEEQINSLVKVV
jgi:putative methionine-R-sulfoxide reductase with GAF domain